MSSINPVVLFGDVGPEVIKLSQIYDPDNDEYILSQDQKVWDTSKKYYTRSYSNKIVTFTEVIGVKTTDNPHALGWYEINSTVTEQKGKYVPAPKSLVVVDQATDDWTERTILIVDSVDETTLKSTLVPHNCGTEGETSARALDYGNDRFMLYNAAVGDSYNNIQLFPDRKLALYGKHYYMYELRKGGEVISSPTKIPSATTNALIPFISATAKTVTITATNYGEYTGKIFDVPTGFALRRVTIPAVPEEGDSAVLPTLDAVYKDITSETSTRTYVVVDADGTKHTETTKVIRPYFLKNDDGSYTYLEPGTEEEYLYGRYSQTTDTVLTEAKKGRYFTYDLEQLATTTVFQASGTYYRRKTTSSGCINYTKLTLVAASGVDPLPTDDYVKVGQTVASKKNPDGTQMAIFGCGSVRAWRPVEFGTSDEFALGTVDYYADMPASKLDIPFYERIVGNVITEGGEVGKYNRVGYDEVDSYDSTLSYYYLDASENYVLLNITSTADFVAKKATYGKLYTMSMRVVTTSVANICNLVEDVFGDGVEGYIDMDASTNHVYYPDACYAMAGAALVAGEPIVMNVFELLDDSHRQVMTVTLFVKDSDVATNTASTKKIAGFDVEISDVALDTDGAWKVNVGSNVAALVPSMHPTLTFDDGSEKIVDVDNISSYVYGIDSVNTSNIGEEFTLLFKYFPEKAAPGNGEFHLTTDTVFLGGKDYYTKSASGVYKKADVTVGEEVTADTYYNYLSKGMSTQMTSNAPKRFLSCRKVIRVVNTADATIRKISIFPVWDPTYSEYKFKYALYTTDMTVAPKIVDDYGSIITMLNGTQVTTANMMYMDDSSVVRPSTDPEANFGYIQHGVIAVYATATGYTDAIYTHPLAIRLQNWTYNSIPIKWLIGDDTSAYDEANMPYGNGSTDIRPYIQYDSIDGEKKFKIGTKFVTAWAAGDTTCFVRCFYTAANPPAPLTGSVDPVAGDPVAPTHFRIRSYTGKTFYEKLGTDSDDEKAVEDVVYYTEYGKQVTVIPGVTNVHNYIIKAQSELDYYTKSGDVYTKVTGEDLPTAGTILTETQRYNWYLKREEEIVTEAFPIGSDTDDTADSWRTVVFALDGAQRADAVTGGSIPSIVGSNYNTLFHGNVVVEFLDCTVTSEPKYLYGVPVEVRHPYRITTDVTYQDGTDYYVYDADNNKFVADPDQSTGAEIVTTELARYVAD